MKRAWTAGRRLLDGCLLAATVVLASQGCGSSSEGTPALPTTAPTTTPTAPTEPPLDPAATPWKRLTITPRTLEPGVEQERCLVLPAAVAKARIRQVVLDGSLGLHHAIVYAGRGAFTEGEIPCFGLPEGTMTKTGQLPTLVFAGSTQVRHQDFTLPDGIALELTDVTHFVINHHFLNATSTPREATLAVDLFTLPDDQPSVAARSFTFGAVTGIDVPARGSQQLTTTCKFPQSTSVLSITPHMHQAGTGFTVRRSDDPQVLVQTSDWSNPETTLFSPALSLPAGQGLTFTCAWQNLTDEPLRFGPKASDEMCFVFGYYYPATTDLMRLDATGGCTYEK